MPKKNNESFEETLKNLNDTFEKLKKERDCKKGEMDCKDCPEKDNCPVYSGQADRIFNKMLFKTPSPSTVEWGDFTLMGSIAKILETARTLSGALDAPDKIKIAMAYVAKGIVDSMKAGMDKGLNDFEKSLDEVRFVSGSKMIEISRDLLNEDDEKALIEIAKKGPEVSDEDRETIERIVLKYKKGEE
jgi:hypothetical protein